MTTKKPVLLIDPGHGGYDPGTSGNGLIEKNLALEFGKALQELATGRGYEARMTRTTDKRLGTTEAEDIDSRAALGTSDIDLMVSLHFNGFDNPTAGGLETWKDGTTLGRQAAEAVQASCLKMFPTLNDRGVKDGMTRYGGYPMGVMVNYCPTVLVECGFLTNWHDADIIRHRRDDYVRAILGGISVAIPPAAPQLADRDKRLEMEALTQRVFDVVLPHRALLPEDAQAELRAAELELAEIRSPLGCGKARQGKT